MSSNNANRRGRERGMRGGRGSPSPSFSSQSSPRGASSRARRGGIPSSKPLSGGHRGRRLPTTLRPQRLNEISRDGEPTILHNHLSDERPSHPDLIARSVNTVHELAAALPLRLGRGTPEAPPIVRSHPLKVKSIFSGPIYDYEVEFLPEPKKRERTRLFELLESHPKFIQYAKSIAHDGSQRLVSLSQLPQPLNYDVALQFEGEGKARPAATCFAVSITRKDEVDMARIDEYLAGAVSPRDYDITPAISALNLFLQRYARSAGVPVGSGTFIRYFFPRDEGLEKCDLGDGIEGLRGFFLSIRPSFTRLLIDVDVCVSAFVKPGNLAEVLLRSKKKLEDVATLPKGFLDSNIHVKLIHLGYSKPLFGIGPKPPNKMTYILDGVRRSAKNYFKQKYGKELLHDGDLPVVNVGSTRKPIWVPPELCEILPGAVYRGAFNSQAMFATNLPKHEVQFMVGQVFRTLGLTRHLGGQPLESVFDIQVRAKGIPLSL